MIGHYLPNNNENDTVPILPKKNGTKLGLTEMQIGNDETHPLSSTVPRTLSTRGRYNGTMQLDERHHDHHLLARTVSPIIGSHHMHFGPRIRDRSNVTVAFQ
jgi:hypothetical protein